MDRKTRHEMNVTGWSGGNVSRIYELSAVCILGCLCYRYVYPRLSAGPATYLADFLFNWAVVLVCITIYAKKLLLLSFFLLATIVLARIGTKSTAATATDSADALKRDRKPDQKAKVDSKSTVNAKNITYSSNSVFSVAAERPSMHATQVAYRPFITLYRSQMMVLTITAILAVDFGIFPREFVKTETWGTSLMDLGVGSFVFSLGIVSSRQSFKSPYSRLFSKLEQSVFHSMKILALGFVRLASVKTLDYQEHVTEYGVHWNFFFTLGLLPLSFTVLDRIPMKGGLLAKAVLLAVAYEIVLKNTGLQEWALYAARVSILSKNKEGVVSFFGYLSVFSFGYSLGQRLLNPKVTFREMIITLVKWTAVCQSVFLVLRTATEPSRRIVNLPYIFWVVAFNAGCLAVYATLEHVLGALPSRSYTAVNRHGEAVFVIANLATGLVNLSFDTLDLGVAASLAVLIAYQGVMMGVSLFLDRK